MRVLRGVLVVAVLALALYLLVFGRRDTGSATDRQEVTPPGSVAVTPGSSPGTDGTGDVVHTLPGGVVSFEVPEGYALAVAGEPLLVQHVVPPCDAGYDDCVYALDDAYAGTNFESAGVSIVLRHDLRDPDACLRTQPDGYSGLEPELMDGSGYATSTFVGLGQGAAGHASLGELRRLWVDDGCYQFETRVAQTRFGNYPQGTIERFTDADEEAVVARLRAFLRSVVLEDGEHPWP